MTLFANSGVAWPKFEQQTQEAGTKSLDAASHFYKLLSLIENKAQFIGTDELNSCARAFDSAGKIYASVADELVHEPDVSSMSPAELELAALPIYRRYYEEPVEELFLLRRKISIRDLYLELSQRCAQISAYVRILNPEKSSEDLASTIFQMMRLWESMSMLARAIATLSRRPLSRG